MGPPTGFPARTILPPRGQAGRNFCAPSALHALSAAARDLLARTGQLPAGERELLGVLTEYRHAVFAFAAVAEKL
jgi:hypothetical protein